MEQATSSVPAQVGSSSSKRQVSLFQKSLHLVSLGIFNSCLVFYSLASGYILIESIRQLFFLSDKAFDLPDYSIYVPRFA